MTRFPQRMLCVAVAILAVFLTQPLAAADVPTGFPYISTGITHSTDFVEATVREQFFDWVKSNHADLSNIELDNVGVYDVTTVSSSVTTVSLVIESTTAFPITNSKAYLELETAQGNIASIFGVPYSASTGTLTENPSSAVFIVFETIQKAYNASWSPEQTVTLDYSPQKDTYIEIACTNTDVEVEPYPLKIAWPNVSTTFRMRSDIPSTTAYVMTVGKSGTDTLTRYHFRDQPEFENSYDANLTITAPDPTVVTYKGTPSPDFEITVPSDYRDDNINNVQVTITSDNAVLSIFPSVVTITKKSEVKKFHVQGTDGRYTLSYAIDTTDNTTDSINFYSPTVTHTITIEDSLNITAKKFPDGHMVNLPFESSAYGGYGGAYVEGMPIQLERPPKTDLTITPSADDVEFDPPALAFTSGVRVMKLGMRALTTGVKPISFTLSGGSYKDYHDLAPYNWNVRKANQHCILMETGEGCLNMIGCQWNEDLTYCRNRTLPITIDPIPQLFHEEPSINILVHLPTKVKSDLTIEFDVAERLTFTSDRMTSSNNIQLTGGESDFNISITGQLNAGDGTIQENFFLKLTGTDANVYDQQQAYAVVRPKIVCNVTSPPNFFEQTESDAFYLQCDTPPETDVIITPQDQTGIRFVALGNTALDAGTAAMTLDSSMNTGRFQAISEPDSNGAHKTGSFTITFLITGTNKDRYDTIIGSERAEVRITIFPSGEVLTPPTFYQTAYEWTVDLNMDITVVSPNPLQVRIRVKNVDGTNVTTDRELRVEPSLIVYKETKRGLIKVYGTVPGEYTLHFKISGDNSRNYKPPKPMNFFIMDRLDGSAFTARLSLGFVPTARCRVNIGRNSEIFKGQDPIDDQEGFCNTYTPPVQPNTTYDCAAHVTEERCRNALDVSGFICVWHTVAGTPQCIHLPELQGITDSVAYGSGFTLLKDTWGGVWSIGNTRYGQLGHFNDELTRVNLPENASQIVAGTSHSMALTGTGILYAWGVNSRGQLGINSKLMQTEVPTKVPFAKGENVTCITAGTVHSGAVSLTGKVFLWGANDYGQLGSEATYRSEARFPQAIGRDVFNGGTVIAVQAGEYHTMVATAEDGVYSFGSNFMGQLGRPGFDEWMPKPPIYWVLNKFTAQPVYKSSIVGQTDCTKEEV